jgi:uncharacterized repeat protein (TIGR01451 family)
VFGTDTLQAAFSVRSLASLLQGAKSVDTGGLTEVPLGDVITYTITISNVGLSVASDVVITDSLPAGVSFGDWVQRGSALLPPPGNTVIWGPHEVAKDDGFTIRFTAIVTSSPAFVAQTITNTMEYKSPYAGSGSSHAVFDTARDRFIYLPVILKLN